MDAIACTVQSSWGQRLIEGSASQIEVTLVQSDWSLPNNNFSKTQTIIMTHPIVDTHSVYTKGQTVEVLRNTKQAYVNLKVLVEK